MSSVSSSPKLFGSRSASEPPSSGSCLGFGASGGRGAGYCRGGSSGGRSALRSSTRVTRPVLP